MDYDVFKQRFKKFTGDFFDLWSFCLIPNHTHYIIKIKSIESINHFIQKLSPENITAAMKEFYTKSNEEFFFNKMIERQMYSFLVSYANNINNKYNRKGGIFQKPFNRIKIEGDAYLQQAIIYTNANAQKHKLIDDYKKYSYSSFPGTINDDQYFVDSKNVTEFFNGVEKFILIHEEQVAYFHRRNWPSSKLE